jgi:hypothetical protein
LKSWKREKCYTMRRVSRLPVDCFEKARKDLRRVEVLFADDDIEGGGGHHS